MEHRKWVCMNNLVLLRKEYILIFNIIKHIIFLIWIGKNRMLKFMVGDTAYNQNVNLTIAVVHTKSKAPDPIRTPKLSDFRRG